MHKIEKIYTVIEMVLGILIGTAALVILVLFIFGIRPYIVRSASMEPALGVGSLCFVNTNTDFTDIKEGDIVTFNTDTGAKVAHRALRVTAVGIETKGDANRVTDGISTTMANYVGKEIFAIPRLGYLVASLQTLYGQLMAVLITAAFLLAGVLIRLLRETSDEVIKKLPGEETALENKGIV